MRWIRLIIGELLLLFASILVFRSAWTMLDEYLGKSNLWLMLVLGIILTVAALILLDYEVKCELEKKSKFSEILQTRYAFDLSAALVIQ
jgi:hypothetical protein